jgi:hypothetical protein
MTVQHVVHVPQDFPGTTAGVEAALRSALGWPDAAMAGVPARPAFLRFASPIGMIPIEKRG